jgi:hypothetical protein
VAVWIYLFILNPYQMTIKISFFLWIMNDFGKFNSLF